MAEDADGELLPDDSAPMSPGDVPQGGELEQLPDQFMQGLATGPSHTNGTQHPTFNRPTEKHSPAFSLETSPTAADFDWDERGGGRSIGGRFVDGMASLTEHSTRGYMGVASGAAFLRLAGDGIDYSAVGQDINDKTAANTPPPQPALFSSAQLEPFIDAYFQTYHISYPIVHEATFRAQFMEIIPRPKGLSWSVLLHIVAAVGAFAASEVASEVDQSLFEAAKSRMTIDLLETGNLTLVQALTLISNYVQKTNKPNSGYNYLGLAKRMALGIGLHKEFPAWRANPLMLEVRRRVWWCMFIFDVGAIITFSRPLDFPKDGVEVQLPLNVSDSDITASTKEFPPDRQQTTLYTHARCQSLFHLATLNIYEHLIAGGQLQPEEMIALDDRHLQIWLDQLPTYFMEGVPQPHLRYRFCHAKLQWRWRNFRILMYRPYLMQKFMARDQNSTPNASFETAIQRCLTAASSSISLITTFWRTAPVHNVLTCWYSLYFLFQAMMIPMICLRNDPFSAAALGHRDQILDALDVITDMTRLNPTTAQRCHDTVMKLCGVYLTKDVEQWSSPVHESPQTQLNALYSFMWPMTDAQLGGFDMGLQTAANFDFMAPFNPG